MSTKAKARTNVRAPKMSAKQKPGKMSGLLADRSNWDAFQPCGLLVLFGLLLGRREALEALEQLFLGHPLDRNFGVVGIDAGAGRADQRHGIGLGLVDLDELLQGVHEFLAQI